MTSSVSSVVYGVQDPWLPRNYQEATDNGLGLLTSPVSVGKSPHDNTLNTLTDLPCVTVNVLLYKCPPETLESPQDSVGDPHLVIRHSSGQALDETVYGLGIINVLEVFTIQCCSESGLSLATTLCNSLGIATAV